VPWLTDIAVVSKDTPLPPPGTPLAPPEDPHAPPRVAVPVPIVREVC
jgi:hypothetical protein